MLSTSTSAAAAEPTSNGNGRIVWPGGPAKKQRFSLPDNIIYYMIQNPSSPEVYLKLAMSCKYFFEKKPLLIVARTDGEKFCLSKDWQECEKNIAKCCVEINRAKLSCKIWLTHRYFFNVTSPVNALFAQKLYKCENALFVSNVHKTSFENFKLIAGTFKKFYFFSYKIIDNNGNDAMLEEILGSLLNVKEFDYTFRIIAPAATSSTFKKIYKLNNLGDLRIFRLVYIPEVCEVKDIEDFIMKHKDTQFRLQFCFDVSVGYKSQLDTLCDTVIKSETCKCVIEYYGQNEKKLAIMRERYDN